MVRMGGIHRLEIFLLTFTIPASTVADTSLTLMIVLAVSLSVATLLDLEASTLTVSLLTVIVSLSTEPLTLATDRTPSWAQSTLLTASLSAMPLLFVIISPTSTNPFAPATDRTPFPVPGGRVCGGEVQIGGEKQSENFLRGKVGRPRTHLGR